MGKLDCAINLPVATVILFSLGAAVPAFGQTGLPQEIDDLTDNAFVCPDGGYLSSCDSEDIERALQVETADPADFAERCLYDTVAFCSVASSGRIGAFGDVPDLFWQLLRLQPGDGPRTDMLVLAEQQEGFFYLLSARQVDGYLDPPVAIRNEDENGGLILHLPALNSALGNADQILFTKGEGWNWTDARSLLSQADKLLPAGFSTASPVSFNFREMTAFALARRDDDPGCCSTGGVVVLDFEQSDHSLTVSGITFTETSTVEPAWTASADTNGRAKSGDNQ